MCNSLLELKKEDANAQLKVIQFFATKWTIIYYNKLLSKIAQLF